MKHDSKCGRLSWVLIGGLTGVMAFGGAAQEAHPSLPALTVPNGLGVNIHFTDPRPGEMKMLAASFHFVRMDFMWRATERTKGQYDFAAYDRLFKALDEYKIRPVFILDYANPLYDEGLSPHTDAGRSAMAKWAAAAVTHFQGRGVLWEMFNEPNIQFWKPKPNVDDYVLLAKAVASAIRAAAPRECHFGAATSTVDLKFLEACFKAGLLEQWDAVSVHPYRQSDPENAAADYRKLGLLIEKYKPKGKQIPILSGEWGYSTAWKNFDEERQGKYLPRQWMTNLMNDVPLSIWYDWHDDGLSPTNAEHHFGTVENAYFANREPVYNPKPSYQTARAFTQTFNGFAFNKRLALSSPDDYLLLFQKNGALKLAAWTTKAPHEITIPASPGAFHVADDFGAAQPDVTAVRGGLKLTVSDAPLYLEPVAPNDVLRVAAAWPCARLMFVRAPSVAAIAPAVTNPLSRPLLFRPVNADGTLSQAKSLAPGKAGLIPESRVTISRDLPPTTLRVEVEVEGARLAQISDVVLMNPLFLTVQPTSQNRLTVTLQNPDGAPLNGRVLLNGGAPQTVIFADGEIEKTLTFDRPALQNGAITAALRFEGAEKQDVVQLSRTFRAYDDFARHADLSQAYGVVPDGDAKIVSQQSLSLAQPADSPSPAGGASLKLAYRSEAGWKFLRIQPLTQDLKQVEGQPKALGLWIYGDNSNNTLRMRFRDATGQTFQPNGTPISWTGWRYYEFPIDNTGGKWGGDGQIHWPISVDTLALLDM